jgi:hypothetical protein
MKNACRLIAVLFFTFIAMHSFGQQTPAKPQKPSAKPAARLSDSFARAGLKALLAIHDNSFEATQAVENAEVEMSANATDKKMFRLLQNYQEHHDLLLTTYRDCVNQTINIVKSSPYPDSISDDILRRSAEQGCANGESISKDNSCVDELKKAFRARASIAEPADCKSAE